MNQFKEKYATVRIVQWMVTGEIGSHGNHAPCRVDLAIKSGSEDVTHQSNNLEVRIVEVPMLKREHAK